MALCLTALVLYLPAVTWKFLRIEQLGQRHESSLLQGVANLFTERQLFVGVIVLLFSIILPMVKLTALLFLCQPQWRMLPRHRAVTYRVVEHLGRWGMLDVLLVAVMVAFVKLGGLVTFGAGPGLVLFALFVLMSLSASLAFDPHCLWAESTDAAGGATPPSPLPPVSGGTTTAAAPGSATPDPAFPPAPPRSAPAPFRQWGVWIIPAIALLLVGGITVREWLHQPPRIEITFAEGHGIQDGDELRYRGVAVGEVEAVHFADTLRELVVHVTLTPDGQRVARTGSRFWIVRPQFDLTGVEGLDTVVGENYIAVQPATTGGEAATRFRGLDEPPLPDLEFPGGIEVIVESSDAEGLAPGTAVYYRRLRIGGVIASGLNLDQSRIEARIYIRPEYRNLIRTGTVFWNLSGVQFQGGLTELSVHISPVESLLQGGLGVAVPANPGEEVREGHRYRLAAKAEKEWLTWQPALGSAPVPPPAQRPELLPVTLQWTHNGLFRNSLRTRSGWALTVNGRTFAPHDLTTLPEDAIAGSVALQVGSETWDEARLVTTLATPEGLTAASFPSNSTTALRPLLVAEDCFLVSGGDQPPVFIAAGLIRAESAGEWSLDPELPLTSGHHGGALVAHKDGAVIGQITVEGRDYRVQPVWE